MTTCGKCQTTYGGQRTEHCTVCHETFTGHTSGDRHRVGQHGVLVGASRRRCLTPDEMTQLGMRRNSKGHWMLNAPPASHAWPPKRLTAPDPHSGTPDDPNPKPAEWRTA